uniref:Integrator complex subunit 6-A n=1 Tax=Aceria tosichella TaxID=561515 RepID=A0A6G1SD24_9ACAR
MTIILFLIDTSSSMNQRTYLGARPTLLDVAKDTVEKFLKARARDIASRGDRYMLLTFEDPPHNIKAGWKESHAVFMNELKHLTATGVTNMGPALKNAFDLLNLNRMQSGIDTYGVGRAPYYLEPSMIIVITDGSSLTNQNGVQPSLELPMQNNAVPGSELTREPFRWDQRLYSLVLRLTGVPPVDYTSLNNPDQFSSLTAMCSVTAGRSYTITTQRSIMQSIEALVAKVQSGVVIQFEKFGPDPPPLTESTNANNNINANNITNNTNNNNSTNSNNNHQPVNNTNPTNNITAESQKLSQQQQPESSSPLEPSGSGANVNKPGQQHTTNQDIIINTPSNWHSTRSLIYVHRSLQKNFPIGHWPIPEAYWPDPSINLPPRTAHPIVKFSCSSTEPHMLDSLPFDKYELESSPLTQYILSRKQPQIAWQVYVCNSGKTPGDIGAPFGYLKAATNLNCVNLFVMPYNYPMLLPIIDEILKKPQHPGKPPREWKPAFDEYLRTMPPYYANPLKRALTRMGAAGSLVPESIEASCLSYAVATKLKNYKNEAKAQFERLIQAIQHQQTQKITQNLDAVRVLQCGKNLRSQVESTSYRNMTCTGQPAPAFYFRYQAMKNDLNEFTNFALRVRDKANTYSSNENVRTKHTFRNPYDIDRKDLIDQIHLMRSNFMQPPTRIKFKDEDQIHTLPIAQMGNYQDYLKKHPPPLREIESTPVRQHMFGNPFKIDKRGMMVDEADSIGIASDINSPSQKNKKLNPNQRRRGPIPRDFIMIEQDSWRRSPTVSPVPSPSPSPSPVLGEAVNNSIENEQSSSITPPKASPSSSEQNGNSHKNHDVRNNVASKRSGNSILRPTEQDLALRSEIFKHIRGPDRDNSTLLRTISKLQGDKRSYIIEETVREAKRFKKHDLLHDIAREFFIYSSQ